MTLKKNKTKIIDPKKEIQDIEKSLHFTITLDIEMYKKLRSIAEYHETTPEGMINDFIEKYHPIILERNRTETFHFETNSEIQNLGQSNYKKIVTETTKYPLNHNNFSFPFPKLKRFNFPKCWTEKLTLSKNIKRGQVF